MIMDFALQLNLNTSQLRQINACRLYLQVLTFSDISTAEGTHILPNIFQGRRSHDRVSTLKWPTTRRPTSWAAWKLFLQFISSGTKLENCLGSWTATPHQQWKWFYEPHTNRVYHKCDENTWIYYSHAPQPFSTRLQSNSYTNPTQTEPPSLSSCVPTTVTMVGNSIISKPSRHHFPTVQRNESLSVWDPERISAPFNTRQHSINES
jgi:hypothetical protein